MFGAVCIQGPKYCGKTWTGRSFSNSEISLLDPSGSFQNREMAELAPSFALQGDPPRLIDEWQEVPSLWDAVRNEVDRTGKSSTFVLTGSAVPRESKPRHSGVGRIEKLKMRPMTLQESGDSTAEVSLHGLFEGDVLLRKAPETTLEVLIHLVVRGGWPGSLQSAESSAQRMPRNYVDTLSSDDLSRVDGIRRDPEKVSRLLHSLARTMEQATTDKTLIRDMTADASSAPLSAETVADYLRALEKVFVIEEIPSWAPNLRSSLRVNKKPKYHFVDPSLPAAILGASSAKLLGDLNTFGFLFESLCMRDLLVYAEAMRRCSSIVTKKDSKSMPSSKRPTGLGRVSR
uniref:ATP-binding protein n=1 Tax=Gordonibacter sp. An230 TaxID=1965592 RepID=UPI0013A62B3E|nr:AAA family ATPase [Gordonibacter sp. An230]